MYVAITSPYLRDQGVTEWYQSLGSHLVWVTTWVNTQAHTNSTIRFRLNLVCIWIWDSNDAYKNTMSLIIHSLTLFYSLITAINRNTDFLRFLFILLLPNLLALVHYTNSLLRVHYRYQSVQRKCRGPVTFRLWGWKYCSHTWMEIAWTQFFVRWGEM